MVAEMIGAETDHDPRALTPGARLTKDKEKEK